MKQQDNPERFDIYHADGMRRIYIAMARTDNGYDWPGSYGFITDQQVKIYGWIVAPAAIEG